MTGIEATLKIREFVSKHKHLAQPVVICYSTSSYKQTYQDHGFDGFMSKPFSFTELKKVLFNTSFQSIENDNSPYVLSPPQFTRAGFYSSHRLI